MDWDLVLTIAEKIGVSYHARHQWKTRETVPHKWRVRIVADSGGKINWSDFEAMDKKRRLK